MERIYFALVEYVIPASVLLGTLIFVHELGHFVLAKLFGVGVLKFSLGFGPKILGKKVGRTEYVISAFPLGGYVKMVGEDLDEEVSEDERAISFSHQPVSKRAGIVVAGSLFNLGLAVVVFTAISLVGISVLAPEIGRVKEDFPAHTAGLRAGDRIVSADGHPIEDWEGLSKVIEGSKGRRVTVEVGRDGSRLSVSLTPKKVEVKNVFGQDVEGYKIGIEASGRLLSKRYGPIEAVSRGFIQTWQISKMTIIAIVKLLQRAIPAKNLGGPVLIVQLAGTVAQAGFVSFLSFMALISINLGIINLFPIPVLDGGHLMFLAIEGVRRKPANLRFREIAQQVGIVILVLIMILVFYNDLNRIFTG